MSTTVEMAPLSPAECRVLATAVIGESTMAAHPDVNLLPPGSDLVLHQKSGGGNPLFVRNIAIVSSNILQLIHTWKLQGRDGESVSRTPQLGSRTHEGGSRAAVQVCTCKLPQRINACVRIFVAMVLTCDEVDSSEVLLRDILLACGRELSTVGNDTFCGCSRGLGNRCRLDLACGMHQIVTSGDWTATH